MKEININALFSGIAEAQRKANETGKTQKVNISEYAKNENKKEKQEEKRK